MAIISIILRHEEANFLIEGQENNLNPSSIVKKQMHTVSISQNGKLRSDVSQGFMWFI